MKEKVINLVRDEISQFHVFVDDVYVSTEEGKDILNIVLDSPNTIDLKLITEASRVINKLIDDNQVLDDNIYEVDIYSKEKGDD